MSEISNIGLSFGIYMPVLQGAVSLDTYAEQVTAYNHVIGADGGYLSANISVTGSLDFCNDWYANGLARHIVVRDEAANTVFEGFVNSITITLGALKARRGPLMEVVNRAQLVYSTVDTTTTPPIVGARTRSSAVNNTDSQRLYGILQRILSAGGIPTTAVTPIVTTYVTENAQPNTDENLTLGSSAPARVDIEILGYVSWLNTYVYNVLTSGTQTLSAKIQAVLAAALNAGLFSTDYSQIATNGILVNQYDNDDRTALAVIKGLVAQGDNNGLRYTYGFYEGRRLSYAAIGSTYSYKHQLTDNAQRLEDVNGAPVKPYAVLPGRWVQITDFLVGALVPTPINLDPRALFIETVSYQAPFGLSLTGARVATLPQKLARLGLSGVGA